jgi:hypothetical protein
MANEMGKNAKTARDKPERSGTRMARGEGETS